jgi:hypothetical protein
MTDLVFVDMFAEDLQTGLQIDGVAVVNLLRTSPRAT